MIIARLTTRAIGSVVVVPVPRLPVAATAALGRWIAAASGDALLSSALGTCLFGVLRLGPPPAHLCGGSRHDRHLAAARAAVRPRNDRGRASRPAASAGRRARTGADAGRRPPGAPGAPRGCAMFTISRRPRMSTPRSETIASFAASALPRVMKPKPRRRPSGPAGKCTRTIAVTPLCSSSSSLPAAKRRTAGFPRRACDPRAGPAALDVSRGAPGSLRRGGSDEKVEPKSSARPASIRRATRARWQRPRTCQRDEAESAGRPVARSRGETNFDDRSAGGLEDLAQRVFRNRVRQARHEELTCVFCRHRLLDSVPAATGPSELTQKVRPR